jgi:hypothetical protein
MSGTRYWICRGELKRVLDETLDIIDSGRIQMARDKLKALGDELNYEIEERGEGPCTDTP